jgi:hypothetical protein
VLQEVELLVARLDDKIVTVRSLIRATSAERRIGQNDIKPLTPRSLVDRVAICDVWLDLV